MGVMTFRNRILTSGIAGLAPMLLYAFSTGPLPRRTGAPGDQTCVQCHTGTALNGGGGNLALSASSGSTYTAGQIITLTLTVTDPTAAVYGFQATARMDSNPSNGQAGSFGAGAQQRVICEDNSPRPDAGCPSSGPLQFIEHTAPFTTNTITFSWTAPAADAGPVTIYAAANAANGNRNNTGDHIYTTSLKLTPAASTAKPSITSGGVVSASAFRSATAAAPGSWIEIFGANLSTATREWAGGDFNGSAAPTSLDGVSVTVGGRAAIVRFISPTQVNALVPDGAPIGAGVPVVVKNSGGESDAAMVSIADVAPAILAPPSFAVAGKQYAVATFAGSSTVTYVGAAGSIAGVTLRPARAGDVITLYGIGFGPVTPASTIGTIASGTSAVNGNVTAQIGTAAATLQYAGLAPGFVGLYQFNLTVPAVAAGDQPLVISVNGTPVAQNVFLTIGQ
jgi:uncharacterized protein (TIGR03437 family)